MEETAEPVASAHCALPVLGYGHHIGKWIRRFQLKRPVRAMPVVVVDVDAKDLLQVASPDDQQPVEALRAGRADPAFGVGVRVGRLHRRDQHLGALRAEHVVKAAGELRVPVAEQEAQPPVLFPQHQQEVRACWVIHEPSGLVVTPARWTRRVSSSMKNSTYNRRSHTVSTVKKSHATIPAACWRRKIRQVVATRRGAGSNPWWRMIVRIVVAETRTPRRWSSPLMRW